MISIKINNNDNSTEEQENETENEKYRLTGKEGPKYNNDSTNKKNQIFFNLKKIGIFFIILFIFYIIFIITFIISKIINGKKDRTNKEIKLKELLNITNQQNNIIKELKEIIL